MIEQLMIFALGVLSAGLISIAILPAFWRRAERLVRKQLERQLPLSPREIAAERDQLRAAFAVEQRRLEQRIESVEMVRAADRREIGEKLIELRQAHDDITSRDETIAARNAELNEKTTTIATLRAELAASRSSHEDTVLLLRQETEAHAALKAAHGDLNALADARSREIGELKAALAAGQANLSERVAALADTEQRLADQMRLHKDLQSAFMSLNERAEERKFEISNLNLLVEGLNGNVAEQALAMQSLRQTLQSRIADINDLKRQLSDAQNQTAHQQAQTKAAEQLAARRQEAVSAKSEALQAKSNLINDSQQQIATLRASLRVETEARRAAERDLEQARRSISALEASIQRTRQESQETARDLSRTIESLKGQPARRRAETGSAKALRAPLRSPGELAKAIPESDIVDLPSVK